jgi:hypothetical protein
MSELRRDERPSANPTSLHSRAGARLRAIAVVAAWVLLAPAVARAQVSVSETFDADLGAWDTLFGAQADGFDIGWSASSLAGGSPGEFGGLFVRVNQPTGDLSMPRALDTASFSTPIDLDQPFHAEGRMYLDDDSDDAGLDVHVGFFRENNPTNERVILRILPNGLDSWRFRMAVNASQGTRIDAPLEFDATPLVWSFDWTPSGAGDGTGTATGTVSDGVTVLTLPSPLVGANAAMVDSFGVWANSASATDPSRTQRMYFDDVTYTAPEPTAALLACAALATLSLAGRAAGRRPR